MSKFYELCLGVFPNNLTSYFKVEKGGASAATSADYLLEKPLTGRILEVDGLRAVAVMLVILHHFSPTAFPGGFVGVDIFFLISGFVIAKISIEEHAAGRFSIGKFFQRRIVRILPSLIVLLLAVLATAYALLTPEEMKKAAVELYSSAFFISNFHYFQNSDYFATESTLLLLLHNWSLAVEEQFYILFPFVFWLVSCLDRKWIGLILAAGFTASLWVFLASPENISFYMPHSRAWEFLAGAFVALIYNKVRLTRSWHIDLIVAAFLAISSMLVSEANRGIYSVVCIASVAIYIATINEGHKSFLKNGIVNYIGKISFPMYLWHWPIIVVPNIIGLEKNTTFYVAAWVFLFLISTLNYELIERRLRRSIPVNLFAFSALALCLAIGVGSVAISKGDGIPRRMHFSFSSDEGKKADLRWDYKENKACLDKYPSKLRREGWWFCYLEDNPENKPKVAILGNSFANHLVPGFLSEKPFGDLAVVNFGVCFPTRGIRTGYTDGHPCWGDGFIEQERIIKQIIQEDEVKVVVLAAPWPRFGKDGEHLDHWDIDADAPTMTYWDGRDGVSSQKVFEEGVTRTIDLATKAGKQVVVILKNPQPEIPVGEFNVSNCYSTRPLVGEYLNKNPCTISRQVEQGRQREFKRFMVNMAKSRDDVTVVDPLDVFCDETECKMGSNNALYLRDIGHLTVKGSQVLAKWMGREWKDSHNRR